MATMTAENLVLTLAGEHMVSPALLVEIIQENPDLKFEVRNYGRGIASYESVSESVANYL